MIKNFNKYKIQNNCLINIINKTKMIYNKKKKKVYLINFKEVSLYINKINKNMMIWIN